MMILANMAFFHRPATSCWLGASILLAFAMAMPKPHAQEQAESTSAPTYLLSTASTGGAFHQGGVSLAALIKLKLLPEKNIDLATRNSFGSMQNILRLRDGTSDFAIVQGLLGHQARQGTGPASDLGPQRDLLSIAMLWPNVEHFIVHEADAPTGTIDDFVALEGRRVSLGREASAIESNRVLLANLGLDIGRDLDQAFLAFRPSADAFRRGQIDGLSLPATTPIPAFAELIGQLGPDAKILKWTANQLAEADGGLGLWSPISIPANTYPGQTESIDTIAQPNFLAVRADVDDDVVYNITRTIFENLPFLRRLHEPFKFLTLETAIRGLPVPLHPGAVRYYREARLDLSNALLADNTYDIFGSELPSAEDLRAEVNRGTVSLMTPEDGTSDRMVNDLIDVMSTDESVRVLPMKGKGAAYNLADLLYMSGVDIGVLQADAIELARRQNLFTNLVENVRLITKWQDLEVHLLVRDDILKPGDLLGKPVNFGPRGSGSEVTASLLFNRLRIPVQQRSFGHGPALEKLKAGEIAGMIYVAGKPIPLFDGIEVRDGLRLLPLSMIDDDGVYHPATLTESDYPTLVFGNRKIQTIAVPSVLAAYDWPEAHERYQPIAAFIDRFLAHLRSLQTNGYHPKWRDTDPAVDLGVWRRHQVVEAFLRQADAMDRSIGRGGPLTPPSQPQPNGAETAGPTAIRSSTTGTADSPAPEDRRPVF